MRLSLLLVLLAVLVPVATAHAASSITIGVPSGSYQDGPARFTATGSAEAPDQNAYVRVRAGDVACPALPDPDDQEVLAQPTSGAFTVEQDTPVTKTGTITACGYLAPFPAANPTATDRAVFVVRRANATLTLQTRPTNVNAGTTIDFAGTTETARTVFVRVAYGDVACPATANEVAATGPIAYPVSAPGFRNGGSFTPDRVGTYTACGYVARTADGPADATARATFASAPPASGTPYVPPVPTPQPTPSPTPLIPVAPVFQNGVLVPVLSGPATAARGVLLNPTFAWALWPAVGASADRLRISRVGDGGQLEAVLELGSRTTLSYVQKDDDGNPAEFETKNVAKVTRTATSMAVRLTTGLEPGTYRWSIRRLSDSAGTRRAESEVRTFVVDGPRVTRLSTTTRRALGRHSAAPGWARVQVKTVPYATVAYTVTRRGRTSRTTIPADSAGLSSLEVEFTCERAGGRYRVAVVASDQHGGRRTARTSFAAISRGRCTAMHKAEARAIREANERRAARQREADRRFARRQAEIRRAERRAEEREARRYVKNCRAAGGRPVEIEYEDGTHIQCRAPGGGLMPVPGFDY